MRSAGNMPKHEEEIIESEDQLGEPDNDDSEAGGGQGAVPVREDELEDADELEDDPE
jgi:hypothetical protein